MTAGPLSLSVMERSRRIFPGGVNSPVRSFSSVGGNPIAFSHGAGKHLFDVDGRRYVDFCSSWGPLILGYSDPDVVGAVQVQAAKALTFGAPSALEIDLAELVCAWIPGLEMMRFVNSGTEATMSAMRAARAATGRKAVVKFEGHYHGHQDALLVKAGSGLATLGNPSSAGVPEGAVADTIVLPFNDIKELETLFRARGSEIACVLLEPMAANMGLVLPIAGFHETLRALCTKYGAVLVFDEVMTGFRIAKGGAQDAFKVQPDLWTFGKIIGGGLPAAAYGGKREIMQHVAPLGRAYQAGTLSGNPLAMAAGLATLRKMERIGAFEKLEALGVQLDSAVSRALAGPLAAGRVAYVRKASFFCFFFGAARPPVNFAEVAATDMASFSRCYHTWLEKGLYMGPSGYEVGFLSVHHEREDLEALCNVVRETVSA